MARALDGNPAERSLGSTTIKGDGHTAISGDLENGESGIATQVHGTDKLPFRDGQGVGWCDENARNARTALEMAPVVTLIRRVPVHWRFRVCEHVQMIGLTSVFQTLS